MASVHAFGGAATRIGQSASPGDSAAESDTPGSGDVPDPSPTRAVISNEPVVPTASGEPADTKRPPLWLTPER
jgi:hypothetical protein